MTACVVEVNTGDPTVPSAETLGIAALAALDERSIA
jgi:hypothetical protein